MHLIIDLMVNFAVLMSYLCLHLSFIRGLGLLKFNKKHCPLLTFTLEGFISSIKPELKIHSSFKAKQQKVKL